MGAEFVNLVEFKGIDLVGSSYEPMFPYFKDNQNSFVILHGDFVSTGDGTGIVHCAPAFGEDDNVLCKEHNIKTVCPVDEKGKFTIDKKIKYILAEKEEELDLFGFQVFEKNSDIIKYLKSTGLWIFTEQYNHNYPHCWRTDTPLIYKSVSSWFLEVEKIRDKMVELNKEINWFPSHIKDGHFGKWIENARSWCISRNRFWGCPIPVWKSENPENKELYVFGSIKELEEFLEKNVR
jgi:isoleucyl-tRNA synthetase